MIFWRNTRTARIHTLETVGTKREYVDSGEDIDVFVQPMSDRDFLMYEGNIADTYKAYTKNAKTIKQSDRLQIANTMYDVRSVVSYDYGENNHSKIILYLIK